MPQQVREPVAATSLTDEIAFRLQAAILDGEFPPGTHLQQDELCARFGVSRTPVREALRKLQAQHLVDVIPNKGATVRVPSRAELSEVYALRAELEGFASELAAANIDAGGLEALDRAQAAMEAIVQRPQSGTLPASEEASFNSQITAANQSFHAIIHEAAGNERLRRILDDLQNFFPKDYVWRAIESADEARTLAVDEHHVIRAALEARDGAAARKAMSGHVAHAGALLLSYLDEHMFWQ